MTIQPNTAKKPSAKDLLNSLTAGKKPTKATTTSNRPDLELTPAMTTSFERFAGAESLLEVVEARMEQEKNFLNDNCFQMWVERLWKSKSRPANPELKIEKNGQLDIQGIFQVQERYTFNAPAVPDNKTLDEIVIENLVDLFIATGMNPTEAKTAATNLVTNELTLSPKPLIDLSRLVDGHWEGEGKNKNFVEATATEQAIASKLIGLIRARTPEDLAAVGCFTDEEEASLITYKAQVVVKKGFLQRVCTYVNSVEQLLMVFTIVKPVKFPQAKKFAAADTPEEKNRRRLAVACDILGVKA